MSEQEDDQAPSPDPPRVPEQDTVALERDAEDDATKELRLTNATRPLSSETRAFDSTAATRPLTPGSSRSKGLAAFTPGQTLSNRYRISRFIGDGGMGEVYEAEDLELHERIALKTILPEIATDPRVLDRFKREIQLARKVTHPNVCRIFDLQYHGAASETGSWKGATTFLTMELLEGETLFHRLVKARRLTTAEALPIVVQMAGGLAAAHKAGIVHRDFKCANVILVPSQDYEGGSRAVITDFGLARLSATAETPLMTVSQTGEVIGTPAYMAPEQVRGEDLTPATDVYSFGVVLFELITGTLPFQGGSPLSVAIRRLEQAPPSPRTIVPDLDPNWESAIMRCLERNPLDRFASPLDVVRAIHGEVVTLPVKAIAPSARPKKALYAAAGLAALLLASGIGYRIYFQNDASKSAAIATPVNATHSIAVLDLKNVTGRESEAWLSEDLARTVSDNLSVGNQLAVIPTRDVLQAINELKLVEVDALSPPVIAQLGRRLHADYIVTGSYLALGKRSGGQVRVDLRLLDAASGKTLASIQEKGTEEDMFALLGRPSDRLRQELGVPAVTTSETADVIASIPANPDAARPYSEGLKKLHSFDTLAAIPLLEQAIKVAPKYPLIHADLAGAWAELGHDAQAQEEAKKAFDLSRNLSPDKQSLIEGRYREATHEWDKAVAIYRALWIRFPEQPEFGFRLAAAQTAAGKGNDALATLDGLRKLQSPQSPDPRIEIQAAEAYDTLSDYRSERDAASKAEDLAQKIGSKLLRARALLMDCWASLNLGDPERAKRACEDARGINQSLGNRSGEARAVSTIASALANQGDIAGAKKMFQSALEITQKIGDKNNMQGALNNLANMMFAQGDLVEANKFYTQGLALAKERGNKVEIANLLNNIAGVYHAQGNLSEAERKYDEALAQAHEIDNQATIARVQYNFAMLVAERGDLDSAMNHYRESQALWSKLGSRSSVAGVEAGMADVLMSQGDVNGAAKLYQRALETQRALGERNNITYTQLGLAQVSWELGKTVQAEAEFRRTAGDFASQKDDDDEALARAALSRVLIGEKKIPDAQKEVQRASDLAKKSSNAAVRLSVSVAAARLNAAMGQYEAARKGLVSALAEANKIGLVAFQFESRLALGEVAMANGKAAAGREMLELLKQEAGARGFALIARKADAQAGKKI